MALRRSSSSSSLLLLPLLHRTLPRIISSGGGPLHSRRAISDDLSLNNNNNNSHRLPQPSSSSRLHRSFPPIPFLHPIHPPSSSSSPPIPVAPNLPPHHYHVDEPDPTHLRVHLHPDHDAAFPCLHPHDSLVSVRRAHRLLRFVQVDRIKQKLKMLQQETMSYPEFLHFCLRHEAASSLKDAKCIAKMLDDAGVILIFRDVVYLKPKQVAQLVIDAIPKPILSAERQSLLNEVSRLENEKKDIDLRAQKHSHRVLWLGFGYFSLQTALIFRLTFWELSWDVMEPIAYFVTTFNLLIGYAFFLITSREPTYQDIGRTLFSSKQQKLMKKKNLDMARLCHLKKQCHPFNLTWQQSALN